MTDQPPRKPIKKAVFPVAGLGTRFLPATKAVPKEMLTIVDRPIIQHVVDEARAAGIEAIRRPEPLSGPEASVTDAIEHALGQVSGDWDYVAAEIGAVNQEAISHGAIVKVIFIAAFGGFFTRSHLLSSGAKKDLSNVRYFVMIYCHSK